MKIRALFCCAATVAVAAFAQDKSAVDPLIVFRSGIADALIKGEENPAKALDRLRAHAARSGLKVEKNADFALAAVDVGLRLIAADKAAEAEQFFLAAETALEKALKQTKDDAAQEKALYFQQLAFVRDNFLNKSEAAGADLEAAIKLQPDDPHLQKMKANRARDKAEQFKAKAKN